MTEIPDPSKLLVASAPEWTPTRAPDPLAAGKRRLYKLARKPRFSVDPNTYDLATHFLPPSATEGQRRALAQTIQDAVEEWCEANSIGL